ncbi:MAG: type II toxin-antitoxin system RelE/ParE family toxin [Bacteroidaceae bacterium]|nr:type II toxin-antitoxin system RelE/ParE family toxin [Bacteroidaceae bacterium]
MILIWSIPAEGHLADIIDYIALDNPQAALRIDELIHESADSLMTFPYKGRSGRVMGTRELVVLPSYLLVYEISGNTINILDILHTSQQYPPE